MSDENNNPLLSVIVPMLNEEDMVKQTYSRLSEVLKDLNTEFIFIDDGSTDNTLGILKGLIPADSAHRVVSFSRNFGHQAAFSAGLQEAKGDAVVIIDGDLQDPPELIHKMLEHWNEGYEVIYAQRSRRRGEGLFKLITAKWFYRLLNGMTSVDIPVDTGDYRLMDRKVVDHLNELPERSRFLRGLVCWVGYKKIGVQYERSAREAGESKYPISKMLRLAVDGITSFSTLPLKMALWTGVASLGVGFLLIAYAVISKIMFPDTTLSGWTSLLTVVVFFGAIQLITIGIVGEYIGRIYEEVKQRPLYLVNKVHKGERHE
jgi:glycosyltransferase involved in cell wall biosynthesis